MIEEREFGASLRKERERRGISIDDIAEQTKVSASLLSGMERGDLSRWPAGIFRRAFVRSYAAAVGLDVEATLAEFLRVFPEDGGPARPRPLSAAAHTLRLTLGDSPGGLVDRRRAAGAGIDALVVAACATLGWLISTPQLAGLVTVAAVVWYGGGTLLWGTTPGMHLLRRRIPATQRTGSSITDDLEGSAEASEELAGEGIRRVLAAPVPRVRLGRRDRRAGARGERSLASDGRPRRS